MKREEKKKKKKKKKRGIERARPVKDKKKRKQRKEYKVSAKSLIVGPICNFNYKNAIE